jgi:hypothetical protein
MLYQKRVSVGQFLEKGTDIKDGDIVEIASEGKEVEGKSPVQGDDEGKQLKKLIEMEIVNDDGNKFDVFLVDDGTLDTVIDIMVGSSGLIQNLLQTGEMKVEHYQKKVWRNWLKMLFPVLKKRNIMN